MKLTPAAVLKPLIQFAKENSLHIYRHPQQERKALLDLIAADGTHISICAKLIPPLTPLEEERARIVVAALARGAKHNVALQNAHATWNDFQGWLRKSPGLRIEYEKVIRKMPPRKISYTDVLP